VVVGYSEEISQETMTPKHVEKVKYERIIVSFERINLYEY